MEKPENFPDALNNALVENLEYSPLTGCFRWKKPGRGRRRDGSAGSPHSGGYTMLYIRVDGVAYNLPAHRVAWFLSHGSWPKHYIDHINQEKGDNRLENLREATPSQNLMNKGKYLTNTQTDTRTITHGVYVGVDQMPSGRWRAICARKYLGCYDTPEEAALAYNREAERKFGEYAQLNILT